MVNAMKLQILRFILSILSFLFVTHFIVYFSWIRFYNITSHRTRMAIYLFLFIASISFFIAAILTRALGNLFIIRIYYFLASYWYGLLIYLIMASALAWLFFIIKPFIGNTVLEHGHFWLTNVLYLGAILFSIYSVWNAYNLETTNITVPIKNLPHSWKGKRIAQISDVHLGSIWGKRHIKKISTIIKRHNPEILLITGDLFDGSFVPDDSWRKALSVLKARKGTFYISGNHEVYNGMIKNTEIISRSGIKIIDQQIVNIDDLLLIGIGYPSFYKSQQNSFDIINHPVFDKNLPKILLLHTPTDVSEILKNGHATHSQTYMRPRTRFNKAKELGINLQLSGHTHQGQMIPFTWLTKKIFNSYHYGLNKIDDFYIYTSSGAATWGPPMRSGSRSEVVIITLE